MEEPADVRSSLTRVLASHLILETAVNETSPVHVIVPMVLILLLMKTLMRETIDPVHVIVLVVRKTQVSHMQPTHSISTLKPSKQMHGSSDCADQNSTYMHACIQTFVCICIQHRVHIILLTSPLYAGDNSLPVIVGAVVGAIGIAIYSLDYS